MRAVSVRRRVQYSFATCIIGRMKMSAAKAKATLFELIDRIAKTRQPVEITKRGKTKVRIVPAPSEDQPRGCGSMRGTFEVLCSDQELVEAQPLNVRWNANHE